MSREVDTSAAQLGPCQRAIETMGPEAAPDAAHEALPPGLEQLEAFRIVRKLGKGGMGTVYLAIARSADHGARAGQLVALKVLEAHYLLWRAAGEARHLATAREIVERLHEGAPEDLRTSMIENVPPYRHVWRGS